MKIVKKERINVIIIIIICPKCEDDPITEKATCNNCGSRCTFCDKFNKEENEYERYPCPGCGKRLFSVVQLHKNNFASG